MTRDESHFDAAVRVVLSTVGDRETADRLARQLLDERLIACANLLPEVTSIFRWNGDVQAENEVLIVLKTGAASLERLVRRLQEIHPYEVPEVVCLPPAFASAPYARWVDAETREARE